MTFEGESYELEYDELVITTDDAVLLDVDGGARVWIPQSEIREHDEEAQTMEIPVWLATDRGLI